RRAPGPARPRLRIAQPERHGVRRPAARRRARARQRLRAPRGGGRGDLLLRHGHARERPARRAHGRRLQALLAHVRDRARADQREAHRDGQPARGQDRGARADPARRDRRARGGRGREVPRRRGTRGAHARRPARRARLARHAGRGRPRGGGPARGDPGGRALVSASKRFRRYLRPYLGRFGWACLAMLVVSAFNGFAILLVKPIIDRLFIAQDMNMLWLAVFGLPFLVLLKSVASYIQNYLMSWIGQRVIQEIREDLFRHLHALPLEFYSGKRGADVLSRVTGDLTLVQAALTTLPVYAIRDTLTVLFLIVALLKLDWRFATLALLGSPLSLAALYVLSRKMRESSRQAQLAVDRLHHRFQESVQGMLVINFFFNDTATTEKFREENESFFQPMMLYLRATSLLTPVMEVG